MKLTAKDKREIGYKLNDVFARFENAMASMNMPDINTITEMTKQIEEKKKMIDDRVSQLKQALNEKGIVPKKRPKPRKKKK